MRISRDHLLFIFLFIILIGLAVISAIQRAQADRQSLQEHVTFSSHSADWSGTLALQTWLNETGYSTKRIENEAFRLSDDTHVLVLFDPTVALTNADATAIVRWVERGNTLLLALGLAPRGERLLRALGVDLDFLDHAATSAMIAQPMLGQLRGTTINVFTITYIKTERTDYVSYLNAEGSPILISFPQGRGRVWFTSAPQLFDNEKLQEDANAALVHAMFSRVPRGSLIAFDEYHLGLTGSSTTESRSVQQLLLSTPWGWGILYALLIGLVYMFVNGKRFGRTVPLAKDVERRRPSEYVTSMANLYRRAGKRGLIARHYHRQLKRMLGKPYRINADLADAEFVEELARYRDSLDQDTLSRTLHDLGRTDLNERALVKLVNEAIKLTTR